MNKLGRTVWHNQGKADTAFDPHMSVLGETIKPIILFDAFLEHYLCYASSLELNRGPVTTTLLVYTQSRNAVRDPIPPEAKWAIRQIVRSKAAGIGWDPGQTDRNLKDEQEIAT